MSWRVTAIVVDAATRSILVDRALPAHGAAVSLPAVELPPGEPTGEDLVHAVSGLLGRPVMPIWLRSMEADDSSDSGDALVLTLADRMHDDAAGRRFVDAAVALEDVEPDAARQPIRAWLDRIEGHGDPRTPAWMEPGWFDRVSAWIAERMARARMPATEPSRMTYQSPIGTVIRTRSGARNTYLKCSAPHFRREAAITRALAERTPAWIPEVIDIDVDEGWLLMADFGDRILGRGPESAWADGLRRLAEVQRAWVPHTEALVLAGAQHRPLGAIAEGLPRLLEAGDLAERISASVLERWPELLGAFAGACHELEDLALPEALIHGDPHPWNIAVSDRGLVVFDWSDGAAGPSFVDLAVFLRRTKDLPLRRVLRDAYIDAWSDVAPRKHLERASELAMCVGAVYQVITYQALLPALPAEDRVVYGGSDRGWLHHAVDGLDHGLDAVGLAPD